MYNYSMKYQPTGRSVGRPMQPIPPIADRLLEHVAGGGSLAKFFRENEDATRQKLECWRKKSEEFATNYKIAKECAIEALEAETIEIADSVTDPGLERIARLRCDVRHRAASRWTASQSHINNSSAPVVIVATGVPRSTLQSNEEKRGLGDAKNVTPTGGRHPGACDDDRGEELHISPTQISISPI